MKNKWTKDNRVVIFGEGVGVSSLHIECETVNFVLYMFCSSPNKNHLEKTAARASFEGADAERRASTVFQ